MSRPTQDTTNFWHAYLYAAFMLYGLTFQTVPIHYQAYVVVLQPHDCRNNHGLGYSPFARRY